MANVLSPFGFSQVGRVPGSPAADFAQTERQISSSNTNKIFAGDLVQDLGTGYIGPSAAGDSTHFGVFLGCYYTSVSQQKVLWQKYWPGADAVAGSVYAQLCTDPFALFLCQSTGTNPVAFTDIGANIDISTVTAGNTSTGISGMAVDTALINPATTTYPFRIWNLGSSQYPVNDVGVVQNIDDTVQYNTVLVTFNNMALKTLTGS